MRLEWPMYDSFELDFATSVSKALSYASHLARSCHLQRTDESVVAVVRWRRAQPPDSLVGKPDGCLAGDHSHRNGGLS